jgi:hypothetical protein
MAKKRARKVTVTEAQAEKETRPIRLDLSLEDHERIARCASRLGLSKSAYVRQATFERLIRDERNGGRD